MRIAVIGSLILVGTLALSGSAQVRKKKESAPKQRS